MLPVREFSLVAESPSPPLVAGSDRTLALQVLCNVKCAKSFPDGIWLEEQEEPGENNEGKPIKQERGESSINY